MSTIQRKLWRDLGRLRGQVMTIALVVASGIASYVTCESTYATLRTSQQRYYAETRFGDVFARLERAPRAVAERLAAIRGVATVYPHIVEGMLVPMPGLPEPAMATVVSLPEGGGTPLNDVTVLAGRFPAGGAREEALLLNQFAEAHELELGDAISGVLNGTMRRIRITGFAVSPEFILPVAEGQVSPDPKRTAVLWMPESVVAPAFRMEGAFNAVSLKLQPDGSLAEVLAETDRILEPFGGLGAIGRDKQVSNHTLEGELLQLEAWATVVPVIFLGVAAFLLNVVLSRLILLQRPQIATLKAVGYSNRQVGLHYLQLVSIIVLLGAALGLAAGAWLGGGLTNVYLAYFKFPDTAFELEGRVVVSSVLVSLVAAVAGALQAVRGVVKLPPAEAMRPAAPITYRDTVMTVFGLRRILSPTGRMILREIERRPLRLLLSSLGIAMCVAILVVARFFIDAMDHVLEVQFQHAWREDLSVSFRDSLPERAIRELAQLPGVDYAEGLRAVPIRIRANQHKRDTLIFGYGDESRLRRPMSTFGAQATLPPDGLVITDKLAEILGVRAGDQVDVELREGDRGHRRVTVVGLLEEPFGLQAHMRHEALSRLLREERRVSMGLVTINPLHIDDVRRRLSEMPGVAGVFRRQGLLDQFNDQTRDMMWKTTLILTLFAVTIAIGVVYNNARIALSMRSRDLASLRVLGFHRREISAILLGELSVQVILALPIGMVIGRILAQGVMGTVDPEVYRFPTLITPESYVFAGVVTTVAALISALLVRRKLDRLDLIGVLKTRE